MPPALRSLPFAADLLRQRQIDWSWFVKVVVASPVGAVYFTNRYTGVDVTIDIGHSLGSHTWLNRGFTVASLDQNAMNILSPSSITFDDLDRAFNDWAKTPGLLGATIGVYLGMYDYLGLHAAPGSFAGSLLLYTGEFDNHQPGDKFEAALAPFGPHWSLMTPYKSLVQIDSKFGDMIRAVPENKYWGGTKVTYQVGGGPTYDPVYTTMPVLPPPNVGS